MISLAFAMCISYKVDMATIDELQEIHDRE